MELSILFPISQTLPNDRQTNFDFIKSHYIDMFPNSEIVIGIDDSNSKEFCKSRAVNNAAKAASKDILLIADIDMYINKESILKSIEIIQEYGWIIPYDNLIKLNEEQTMLLIHENIYPSLVDGYKFHLRGGGLQIVQKHVFNFVGGYDERFVGWGGEDTSFCASVDCLYKTGYKILDKAYHLYHKRQNGVGLYKQGEKENKKLRDKYWKYADNKDKQAMEKLINDRRLLNES